MTEPKIHVNFFQRKPRKGISYSLEFVFDDIRKRLADKIEYKLYLSKCYNDGFFSKIVNIIEAASRQGKDVNHITGEVNFLNLLMPKKRVILTILDCGMMHRKTGLSKKIIQWLYLSAPVKNAKIITAISEVTKREIVGFSGVNPNNIRVIPVAINGHFQPRPKVFNKLQPVILQIGTRYNKNLERLIDAIEGIHCKLIIVGALSAEQLSRLKKAKIYYRNEYDLSDAELLEKYYECDILSFISTFEGFGMPIVEANAIERAVITSNVSSMPEVAADAAYFVDPYNVEDIRTGILNIINDDVLRNNLIERGRINKLRFDGQKIADEYMALYREIKNR